MDMAELEAEEDEIIASSKPLPRMPSKTME